MLLLLNDLLLLHYYSALELKLLFHLLEFSLLLADDSVAFDDLLLALLQLVLHLLDLSLKHIVRLCQLGRLLLQRCNEHLRLLNDLFFVFNLPLECLIQQHLLSDRLLLSIFGRVQKLVARSQLLKVRVGSI